ncbi:hypothetical protein B0H11DRAFT_2207390 [Mycena galericulata]|nr:hypothetical protein B0H11DRAFT_2207390 [Mycena galericulata]
MVAGIAGGFRSEGLVTSLSDKEDGSLWTTDAGLGWLRPDHSKTTELHAPWWYQMFIDAIIQSIAVVFVGTATSTVSIVARRRVSELGGFSTMVTVKIVKLL